MNHRYARLVRVFLCLEITMLQFKSAEDLKQLPEDDPAYPIVADLVGRAVLGVHGTPDLVAGVASALAIQAACLHSPEDLTIAATISGDRPLDDATVRAAEAVNGLRNAGAMHHLPKALLTAAWYHFVRDEPERAKQCLDEAQQIAERGPMPLYLADIRLYRARLWGSLTSEGSGVKEAEYPWPDS